MRAIRPLLILSTLVWLVLLLAAPQTRLGVALSGVTYAFGSLICHQRPERSFHLGAAQLPVCARCFGLYMGAALGALLFAGLKPCATETLWRSPSGLRTLLVAAAIPTAITWCSEIAGIWSPANITRFVAAVLLGAAVAVTVNYIGCARPPRTGPRSPRIPI